MSLRITYRSIILHRRENCKDKMHPVLRKARKNDSHMFNLFCPDNIVRCGIYGFGVMEQDSLSSGDKPNRKIVGITRIEGKIITFTPRRITISRKAAHPAGATGKLCCCFIIINVSLLPQVRLRRRLYASEPARRRPLRLRREFQPQLRRGVLPLRRRRTARLPGSPVHCAPRS